MEKLLFKLIIKGRIIFWNKIFIKPKAVKDYILSFQIL